jgi:hypothetical protein
MWGQAIEVVVARSQPMNLNNRSPILDASLSVRKPDATGELDLLDLHRAR